MPENQFYTEEEAQRILEVANRSPIASGGMSRDQILQVAAEMGISADAVTAAEKEIREHGREKQDWQEYRDHVSRSYLQGVGSWVGTSIMLAGINLFTGAGRLWSIWPIGIYGLVILKDSIERWMQRPWNDRSKFEEWKRKRDEKAD